MSDINEKVERKGRRAITTIAVPIEVRNLIKYYSRTMHLPMWRLIYEAVTHYRQAYLSHFQLNTSKVNKVAWYAFKLGASVGEFRSNPNGENLSFLRTTIAQIKERLGIDTTLLESAVDRYARRADRKNRISLNDSAKDVIVHIIEKIATTEETEEEKEEAKEEEE